MFTAGRCGAYGSASRWYREGSRFDSDHRLQLLDTLHSPIGEAWAGCPGLSDLHTQETRSLRPWPKLVRASAATSRVAPDGIDLCTLVDCPGRTSWVIWFEGGRESPAGSTPALLVPWH